MVNLRLNLEAASRKLASQPDARLEAEILMAHVLDSPRSFLYANPELDLPKNRVDSFKRLVQRRARGEPIAYITGNREFWSLPLQITPDVLVPRHETELLVETALQRIPAGQAYRLADLGTGSGAIALAVASERLSCEIHATDISPAATRLANANAEALGISSVQFHTGSWCEPLSGAFDMIVSNPPYVAADDPHLQNGDCRFEPRLALSPGDDPSSAFRTITKQALSQLRTGGWLLFEHGTDQGPAVREIINLDGFTGVETVCDLAGHERVTLGQIRAGGLPD